MKRYKHREAWILVLASLLFLATRFWNILSFPIFNDEGIYLQYAQLIHDNFSEYKYISVHNVFGDWKPPLQYWIGALFVNLTRNPLLAGRSVAVVFSVLGVIGIYLFVREVFGRTAGVAAVVFYLASSLTLLYNMQFVAETFVFTTTAVLYACVAAFLRRWGEARAARLFFTGAVLAGTSLLLFKQSGRLSLYLLVLLPLAFSTEWRRLLRDLAAAAAIILLSVILSSLFIPSEYRASQSMYTAQWTMSPAEIASLPLMIWLSNAKQVWEMYARYYSMPVLALILIYAAQCVVKRTSSDITILVLFLLSSAAIILFLRQFNEYIYHTAVVIFLVAMLGRMSALAIGAIKDNGVAQRFFGGASARQRPGRLSLSHLEARTRNARLEPIRKRLVHRVADGFSAGAHTGAAAFVTAY